MEEEQEGVGEEVDTIHTPVSTNAQWYIELIAKDLKDIEL